MLRHLLVLVWQRKRANALLLLEVLVTFVVLFVLAAAGSEVSTRLADPRGYSIDRVWSVTLRVSESGSDDSWPPGTQETLARLLAEVERMPEVAAAGLALSAPYDAGARESSYGFATGDVTSEVNEVSDGIAAVLGLELIAGRWFEPADDALAWRPMVIDRELARDRFGDADPIGQAFDDEGHSRVVGVVAEYRRHDLQSRGNYAFERVRVGNPEDRPPSRLLLRLAPGVESGFQEELARHLHALAPTWSFEIEPLSRARSSFLSLALAPLVAGAVIAGFLLLMVVLGLAGVVYQSLAQRTREIGVRRALGAAPADVARQLIGELLVLTALALAAGSVLLLQLPLVVPILGWGLTLRALAWAALAILALVAVAGWLPARLAARLDPAVALRYE